MTWRIGVDIGGTFTDVALIEEASGRIGVAKVPTTPADPAEGVLRALETAMRRYAVSAADVELLSHATTVVTNALLEEKGARAALVTTRGFRDVLELRRSARAELYDLFQDGPATLIPRRRRFEITERVGADGAVVMPLADAEIDNLIAALAATRVDAVAVSLLFSFLNPEHERRLGARLRAGLPGVPVYLSCEVLPEIKEFERASTTAVCAYVGPLLAAYLSDGIERRRARGGRGDRHAGNGGGIGPRRGRGRRRAGGAADRAPRPHLLRHGRHHRQGEPDPRRRIRDDAGLRGRRRLEPHPLDERHRPSDPRAGDRSRRGVGRGRIDRLGGSRRRAARRPEERGRRPRPGLLRPRRRRADGDRLQPAARLFGRTVAAGGRTADRSRGGGSGRARAARRAARRRRAHGSRRRHRRGQPRHGGGAQDRVGAARP